MNLFPSSFPLILAALDVQLLVDSIGDSVQTGLIVLGAATGILGLFIVWGRIKDAAADAAYDRRLERRRMNRQRHRQARARRDAERAKGGGFFTWS